MYARYASDEFETEYTYTGHDLGANWTPTATTFRLWAPTAEEVTVNLYRTGTRGTEDLMGQLPMLPGEKGTWFVRQEGDLNGVYYTYLVIVDGEMSEVCDPYAKATGTNGHRAMVLDLSSTNPQGWQEDTDPHKDCPITDAVIYEAHIRDLTMTHGSKFQNKGKFLGVAETGLTTPGGQPIGLDHIKNLGVTHLQLLPIFDYGYTDENSRHPNYNWGYDPVNFNVPEGSYASDPSNGAVRVRELKQMIYTLHQNGISVVMDVVYNHVFNADSFCFNKIVPGYFSRIDDDDVYANGSACGNDTASERSMVRKYIVDSLCYWAEEYHIDGFRFDLAGLIDLNTIGQIVETLHRDHPNILLYGEGWQLSTQLTKPGYEMAVQRNSAKLPGFGFFSDTIRDLMRGSVFFSKDLGFASGGLCPRNTLDACFMGSPSWCANPCQSINYVSCHDNHTLFDRMQLGAPDAPMDVLIQMNNLAAAFSILSQGVPFLMAGEEILRTKPGKKGKFDSNSYRSSDKVNAIKWNTLDREEYRRNADYYAGLIAFRKAHPCLRLSTREEVFQAVHPIYHDNPHLAAYHILGQTQEVFAIFNSDSQEVSIQLPQGQWNVYIDGQQAGTQCLRSAEGVVTAAPISPLVLSRKRAVDVVAALLWQKDQLLVCQRPKNKVRGMLWEFVGGKVEPGETRQQALARECMEELGVQVEVGSQFNQTVYEYPDMLIRLTMFHTVIPDGFPQALEHNALRWVHPSRLSEFDFCPADQVIVNHVLEVYGTKEPL